MEQPCVTCWEGDDSPDSCAECGVIVHPHCLDQEGCGTSGCRYANGAPRRAPRISTRGSGTKRPRGLLITVALFATLPLFFVGIPSPVAGVMLTMVPVILALFLEKDALLAEEPL
jgi:hypothetical protein